MAESLPLTIRASESLSEDLISEIVLRLLVKLLPRCKALSKSWKTLISSHDFVKSHLHHTIASSGADDETLIVQSHDDYDVSLRSILLLNVNSGEIVADLNLPFLKDEFPNVQDTCLIGSACGIVCICVCGSNFDDLGFGIRYLKVSDCPIDCIYLRSPATKQSICIQEHTIDVESKHWTIDFGFDHVSNDYKVVKMVLSTFSVEVYSTNRNYWRKVGKVANHSVSSYMCSDIFVCVKGSLCCTRNTHMIAFNLDKEVFNCAIELPITSYNARITKFNDSIVVVNCIEMDIDYNIKLLKLEDETCLRVGGVEASWNLMLNIDYHMKLECVHGYLNNGEFLIWFVEDIWLLFNSDTNDEIILLR